LEIAPDGTTKKVLHYEALGKISWGEATEILAQKLAASTSKVLRDDEFETHRVAMWRRLMRTSLVA
jgi:hypothetical protein